MGGGVACLLAGGREGLKAGVDPFYLIHADARRGN